MATMRPAFADQTYDVSGVDQYSIGTSVEAAHIAYAGAQRLTIDRSGKQTKYTAEARYTRVNDGGKASVRARFVQSLVAGSFEDQSDDDPDFLTVLNQPFAIQLDATTMRDLRTLKAQIPFAASSPLGNSTLRGFLRPSRGGKICGHQVVGVRFSADGPMTGPLPNKASSAAGQTSIAGTISMDGTAYYAADSALLLALDARLTIIGKLTHSRSEVPVKIVYRRTIRANDDVNAWSAADATPQR